MYSFLSAEASPTHLASYADLLGTVFQKPKLFTEAYLTWQYAGNPTGSIIGFDAWTPSGVLAAHYATIPVRYSYGEEEVLGLLSLNTATHPAHQGKGLFTQLAGLTYQNAAEAGFQFVLGVANAQSTPGFLRKLGFSLIAPLEAQIGLGITDPTPPTGSFFAQNTSEYLLWRLMRPNGNYFAHGTHLYAPTGLPGIAALLGQVPKATDIAHILPPAKPLLTLWLGHAPLKKTSGLWAPIPQRLRPSPLNFIYLDLAGKTVPKATDIYLQALDFDAY
jgi:GNAT superfamily N-acetyltransferase